RWLDERVVWQRVVPAILHEIVIKPEVGRREERHPDRPALHVVIVDLGLPAVIAEATVDPVLQPPVGQHEPDGAVVDPAEGRPEVCEGAVWILRGAPRWRTCHA